MLLAEMHAVELVGSGALHDAITVPSGGTIPGKRKASASPRDTVYRFMGDRGLVLAPVMWGLSMGAWTCKHSSPKISSDSGAVKVNEVPTE